MRGRRHRLLLLAVLASCFALAAPPLLPPSPDPTPASTAWGAVVVDRSPSTGARVRLKGTDVSTLTDAQGRFRLRLPPSFPSGRLTAWKEGFLIAGARLTPSPALLSLRPLPAEDNEEYEWVDPRPDPAGEQACANCHAEIFREWSASGHARSASGRHLRNLYEGTDWDGNPGVGWGLLRDRPDGAGVCSACHAPAARESAFTDLRELHGAEALGVHCDFCHKVSGPGEGSLGLTFGRFGLKLRRPSEGQLFFGSLDDVDRGEDAFSPFYRDSRYCASCHEGLVFGVPVYTTYSEWQHSPAAKQGQHCQFCHMAPGTRSNIAPGHGGIERDPRTLSDHRFFAGSQAKMLRSHLRLDASFTAEPGSVRAVLRLVAEGVGHRVPTGLPDRHLILVAQGQSTEGAPVPLQVGPTLPRLAGPEYAGRPGKVYARLLRDGEDRAPVPFWLALPEAEDNRLVPGEPDEVVLRFAPGLAKLRVRLVYRPFWDEVARAKGWPPADIQVIERDFAVAGK